MTYLNNGRYASSSDELTALALEAHRRGVSYGQLVANTPSYDLDEIVREYCGKRVKRKKKRDKWWSKWL